MIGLICYRANYCTNNDSVEVKGDIPLTEQDTGRLLRKAANQLINNFDQFAANYGLTSMQMSVIDYLSRRHDEVVIQRDLEQEFNVKRSTMTLLLQRMDKKGLVVRKQALSDGRQKEVTLTNKSREMERLIQDYMKQQDDQIRQIFGQAEIKQFQRILNYYIEHTNEEN